MRPFLKPVTSVETATASGPVVERGLLPAPSHRLGMPLERWLPRAIRRRMFNASLRQLKFYPSGFRNRSRQPRIDRACVAQMRANF